MGGWIDLLSLFDLFIGRVYNICRSILVSVVLVEI